MNTVNSAPINPPINTLPVLVIPIDWQRVRVDAAIAAFKAMVQTWGGCKEELAADARAYADALIAELQKEVAK